MQGPLLYPLFDFMYRFPQHRTPTTPITIFTGMAHLLSQQQLIRVPTYHHLPRASPYCIATLPSSLSRTLHWVLPQYRLALSSPTIRRSPLTFHNSINRTAFLTEPAVNTLRHIKIISRSPPTPIFSLFSLYYNTTSRANRLAKLACDTSLLARRIPPQRMLSSKAWRYRSFLEWIVDRIWRSKELL